MFNSLINCQHSFEKFSSEFQLNYLSPFPYDKSFMNFSLYYAEKYKIAVNKRYVLESQLGEGTFGKVYRAFDAATMSNVAIKFIDINGEGSYEQTCVEVATLSVLNEYDPANKYFVKLYDRFIWNGFHCLVFEALQSNLLETIRSTHGAGLSLEVLRKIAFRLIQALIVMHHANIIHCDIKPENVMCVDENLENVKIVDLGSSCFNGCQIFNYIQSRFYRSPEVLLELPYGIEIDVWSMGCLLGELATCMPLFDGQNELDQIGKIMRYLGPIPTEMIAYSKRPDKYFYQDDFGMYVFKGVQTCEDIEQATFRSYLTKNRGPELGLLKGDTSCYGSSFEELLTCILRMNPTERPSPYDLILHPFFISIKHLIFLTESQEERASYYRVGRKRMDMMRYDNGALST